MRVTREEAKRRFQRNKSRYIAKGIIPRPRSSLKPSFNTPYTIKTKARYITWIGPATGSADFSAGYTFKLSDIADYTQWTSVFDQYRFKKVTVMVQGANQTSNQASNTLQPLITVIDYDDATGPATKETALNFGSSFVHHPNCNDRRSFVPRSASALYVNAGTFTGNAIMKNQWIDCAASTVLHYGFKAFVPVSTTTNIFSYLGIVEYVIEFKNNR